MNTQPWCSRLIKEQQKRERRRLFRIGILLAGGMLLLAGLVLANLWYARKQIQSAPWEMNDHHERLKEQWQSEAIDSELIDLVDEGDVLLSHEHGKDSIVLVDSPGSGRAEVSREAALVLVEQHLDQAELYYRAIVTRKEDALGWDHPSTLRSVGNLALTLIHQRNFNEAELLLCDALERSELKFGGREHPLTLYFISGFASLRLNQGDLEAAEVLNREVKETRVRVLGKEHSDTIDSKNKLAISLFVQNKVPEAMELLHEEVALRERRLDSGHEETVNPRDRLGKFLLNVKATTDPRLATREVPVK